MFLKWARRRAIRAYALKLPSLLRADYGSLGPYSVGQVTKTVERHGLNRRFLICACALFVERQHFDVAFPHKIDVSYEELTLGVADKIQLGAGYGSAYHGDSIHGSGSGEPDISN